VPDSYRRSKRERPSQTLTGKWQGVSKRSLGETGGPHLEFEMPSPPRKLRKSTKKPVNITLRPLFINGINVTIKTILKGP